MNVIKVCCIFLCLTVLNLKAATHHSFSTENTFNSSSLKLKPLEKRIAHNFNKLFKLSKKNIVNQRLLIKLKRDMKKSLTFYDYKIWPDSMIKINKIKYLKTAKKLCTTYNDLTFDSSVKTYLLKNIQVQCAKKYLNILSKKSRSSLRFHKKEIPHFSKNIHLFNVSENRDELEYLISRFPSGSKKHILYSEAISNYFIITKTIPKKHLIKYLNITPRLTNYIQSIQLEKWGTQNTFWKEFNKLNEVARNISDNNGDKKLLKQKISESLNYFNSTLEYQPKKKIYASLLSLGKSMMRRGHSDLAIQCYERLLKEKDIEFNKVFFEYVWIHILKKDYAKVLALSTKLVKPHHNIKDDSKLTFWIGYSHLEEGNEEEAKEIFEMTVRENPLSYYAILSSKLLSEYPKKSDTKKDTEDFYFSVLDKIQKKKNIAIRPMSFDIPWVKRIMAWSYVSNKPLLNLEFKQISDEKEGFELETHILTAAYKLSESKDYLESFKMIYRSVDKGHISVSRDTLKILFPLPYLNQIKNTTKQFDPIIALSLIRQESGFNRHARSHVGARGLMQLMPNTAKRIKRRVRKSQLYNARLNINIGTKFFNKLLNRYDNNLVYSLAAYNAGQRRIDDWQEKNYVNPKATMLSNIENIPFLETRKYVKLIFRNIFFYKLLIGSNDLQDPNHFNKIYDIHVGFNR